MGGLKNNSSYNMLLTKVNSWSNKWSVTEQAKKDLMTTLSTNVEIIQLPALTSQDLNDIYEVSKNGTGSYKETRAQMLAFMQANIQGINIPSAPLLNISSNTVLTFPLPYYLSCFFSGSDGIVTLPNNCNDPSVAIQTGYTFYIENTSIDRNAIIKDSTGFIITTIPPQYTLTMELNDNVDPQGEWFFTLYKTAQYRQTLDVVADINLFYCPEFTYIMNNSSLIGATLSPQFLMGDIVNIVGRGSGGWEIAQNAGQVIKYGTASTTVGVSGGVTSIDPAACIRMVATNQNTEFTIVSATGNFTLA